MAYKFVALPTLGVHISTTDTFILERISMDKLPQKMKINFKSSNSFSEAFGKSNRNITPGGIQFIWFFQQLFHDNVSCLKEKESGVASILFAPLYREIPRERSPKNSFFL